MSPLDSILEKLADALELERELGVRSVEIDRALLTEERTGDRKSETRAETERRETRAETERRETRDASGDERRETRDASGDARRETRDASGDERRETRIVFLHDRALSAGAVAMMAKIVTAMHETAESAPILFTGERPAARATVVLGGNALKKWFPGSPGAPGQWISPNGLANVLVTYSPEFILRRGLSPEAVQKLKREMWNSLKQVIQRLASQS